MQSAHTDEALVDAGFRAKLGQWLGTGAVLTASAGDLVGLIQDPPVFTSTEHRVLAFGLSSVDASGMLQSASNELLALGTKHSPEGTEAGVAIGVFGPAVLSGLDVAGPAVKLARELDELGEVVLDAAKQGLEEGGAVVEASLKHDLSAGKFLASKRAPAAEKLALGLGDRLDAFAAQHGASTWKSFSDPLRWKRTMLDKLADPDVQVVFNLEGVEVWPGVSRASRGAGGATDWELLQIKQNPEWWDSIEWWNGNKRAENPFQ